MFTCMCVAANTTWCLKLRKNNYTNNMISTKLFPEHQRTESTAPWLQFWAGARQREAAVNLQPLGSKYPLLCRLRSRLQGRPIRQGSIYTVMSLTSSRSHFPCSYSSQYSYTCFYLCDI